MAKPLETRGQFVSAYLGRSGETSGVQRVRGGFILGGVLYRAHRCKCGNPICTGWRLDTSIEAPF